MRRLVGGGSREPAGEQSVIRKRTEEGSSMVNVLRDSRLVVLWVLSLGIVGVSTAGAQAPPRPRMPEAFLLDSPTILTGDDVGFRLEHMRDRLPVGRVVVRVDGRWVEPQAR